MNCLSGLSTCFVRQIASNQSNSFSFQDTLSGEDAFFNKDDYIESTRQDFSKIDRLPVSYRWDTESKVSRVAKEVFYFIIVPVVICSFSLHPIIYGLGLSLLYNVLHVIVGKIILPASNNVSEEFGKDHLKKCREGIDLTSERKFKRFTVEVDGYGIDAVIIGNKSTLANGRWTLASLGNGQVYENKLENNELEVVLRELHSNAIVFNYPGVGGSSGQPNRQAMIKAYRAMLTFLEDEKHGVGAKEIIGYGFSIGGGVQGDALNNHRLKEGVKYIFVKDRTFSNLSTEVSALIAKPFGVLVKVLGWNLDSVESSKKLLAHEIIMQTAWVNSYEQIHDSSLIKHDGIIPADASLAKALLDDLGCCQNKKTFMGVLQPHNGYGALIYSGLVSYINQFFCV